MVNLFPKHVEGDRQSASVKVWEGGGRGQIMVKRISTPVLIATSEHPNHARFHAPEQGISAKRGWRPEIEKEEGPE